MHPDACTRWVSVGTRYGCGILSEFDMQFRLVLRFPSGEQMKPVASGTFDMARNNAHEKVRPI